MKISHGRLAALIIVVIVVLDQIIKIWVKTHMCYDEEITIFSWMRIHFIENNGMAFGMELGSKLFLTCFRLIVVVAGLYYMRKLTARPDIALGFKVCVAMILAGAAGNLIDCMFYGIIFNDPPFPFVAQLFPEGGGYGSLLYGRVVDMFYFPLAEWDWPSWVPVFGGEHFLFFQPIFNLADASLSVAVITLVLFYSKYLALLDNRKADSTTQEDAPTKE